MTPLDRLLAKIDPLFRAPQFDEKALPEGFKLSKTHRQMLSKRNGGYFYGGALHVFGACAEPEFHSLATWNHEDTWRTLYGDTLNGFTIFAEDAFGDQFMLDAAGKVFQLRAEQGIVDEIADDLDQWVLMAVEAPDELLGRPILARWASQNGRLPPGSQLQAYPPFFLADDPDAVELSAVEALENIEFHATIASQLASIPDNVRVRIDFTEEGMQIVTEPLEPAPEGEGSSS